MIEQRINLYQERFHEKRTWISAGQLVGTFCVVVLALGLWSYLLHAELANAHAEGDRISASRDSLTAELQTANAELEALLKDTRLDREIETTARKIAARKQVLNFVDGNQFGSGAGFSEYLVALSNLQVDDIWLSEIQLAEDFVRIRGSALDAATIPTYFTRFGDQRVFRGGEFDLFQLQRDAEFEWKVDFEIATREVSDE